LLGSRVGLYQIHSVTPDSPALHDDALLDELAMLRDTGVRVGLSTSGPHQGEVIREALTVEAGGTRLFSAVQATWNLLEPSAGDALAAAADAGWFVMVKEALANGRLAGPYAPPPLAALAGDLRLTADAVAIGAVLALPFEPTVLLGPVSVAQLASNLTAVIIDQAMLGDRLAELAESPVDYWAHRSGLAWH
jgi:aryl-alcohol dehydrogenase-like predicted oxidoreductase